MHSTVTGLHWPPVQFWSGHLAPALCTQCWLQAAYETVSSCECEAETGCPQCIQLDTCSQYNEVLHKSGAIMILRSLVQTAKQDHDEALSTKVYPTTPTKV